MRSFGQFKAAIDPVSGRETVGLAVYYLQTYEEEDTVSASQVRDLYNVNDIPMSEPMIATHLYNLKDDGFLQWIEHDWNSGYRLTPEGTRRFERKESGEIIGSPPPEKVDTQNIEESYEELYNEAQDIRNELEMVRISARRWRRKSWLWRIGSFVIGILIGRYSNELLQIL